MGQPKLTQVQEVQYRLQSATWYAWAAGLNLVRGHFACLRTQAIATVGYNQLTKMEGSPQIVSISVPAANGMTQALSLACGEITQFLVASIQGEGD